MAILNEAMKKRSIKIMLDALDKAPNTEKALLTTKLKDLGVDVPAFVIPPPKSSINEDAFNVRNLGILERSAALPRRADVFPDIYETKELDRRINALKPLITRDIETPGRYDDTVRESLKQSLQIPLLKEDDQLKKLAMKTYLDAASNQVALNLDNEAFSDALAMSDAYKNAQPRVNIIEDVITPKKETTEKPSKLTPENLGNIYKYILLPLMGIAETVSTKGKSPGVNALAAMSAFDSGYANRKAKEVADLKFAEEKKEITRKDTLRKALKDLEGLKVGDISTMADKNVVTPIDYSGEMIPSDIPVVSDDMFDDNYLVPSPVTVQKPNISVEKINDRKRASLAKMLGVTEDKLIGSEAERTARAQDVIEGYVRETDPLKYYEMISKKENKAGDKAKEIIAKEYLTTSDPARRKTLEEQYRFLDDPKAAASSLGLSEAEFISKNPNDLIKLSAFKLAESGQYKEAGTLLKETTKSTVNIKNGLYEQLSALDPKAPDYAQKKAQITEVLRIIDDPAKAARAGMITPEEMTTMTPEQIQNRVMQGLAATGEFDKVAVITDKKLDMDYKKKSDQEKKETPQQWEAKEIQFIKRQENANKIMSSYETELIKNPTGNLGIALNDFSKQIIPEGPFKGLAIYGVNKDIAKNNPQKAKYLAAALDFITAQLRQESGAAISPTEFDSAYQIYMAGIGENKELINAKQLRRSELFNDKKLTLGDALRNKYFGSNSTPVINGSDDEGEILE